MWEVLRVIFLLVLISSAIVTLDKVVKRVQNWKIWVSATAVTAAVFLALALGGPPEVHFTTPGQMTGEKSSSPGGEAGEQAAKSDGSPQGENAGQNNSQQEISPDNPEDKNPRDNNSQNSFSQDNASQDNASSGSTAKDSKQGDGTSKENAPEQNSVLFPVDDASQSPGFLKFREDFLTAVRKKDLDFLKQHVSENIKYSFGETNGIKGFLVEWGLNSNAGSSGIWSELYEVLTLGGAFDKQKTVFTAPYVFAKFPSSLDRFQYSAVINQNVNIYSEPNSDSRVIMGLSYNILKLADNNSYPTTGRTLKGEAGTWKKVLTPSGQKGYINEKYLRRPVDYRAQFTIKNGEWQMIFFVAGD